MKIYSCYVLMMHLLFDPNDEIKWDVDWHLKGLRANLKHKDFFGKLECIRHAYMDISDSLEWDLFEYHMYEKNHPVLILYYHFQSIIYECNIFQINCLFNGYVGALRSSRMLMEATITATAAVLDPSKLGRKRSMTLTGYIRKLKEADKKRRLEIDKKDILRLLKIGDKDIEKLLVLYQQLSQNIHFSTKNYTRPLKDEGFHSRLQYNPTQLKNTFQQIFKVLDFCMYVDLTLMFLATTNTNKISLIKYLKKEYFRQKDSVFLSRKDFPLIWKFFQIQLKMS